ncbi:MAG: ABC transporter ATP-binding protein [Candidatus Poribacteria bacterium]|nr:ABC transporter ATP-binding protein [Candidatus Poribacteria bacterium]
MAVQLSLKQISKTFQLGDNQIEVLRDVSFSIDSGQSLAITGPSGSGKSTLLHLIGTLDSPTTGQIQIDNQNPFSLSEPDLARFRNRTIGFVFQDHHLLPQYSVIENVLIPTLAFGKTTSQKIHRGEELLEKVGLSHRIEHRPAEMSGGERQRVAIARALINQPGLILCDEPTGNLDRSTADQVSDLLLDLHHQMQNILVVVTHSPEFANRLQRRIASQPGHTFGGVV